MKDNHTDNMLKSEKIKVLIVTPHANLGGASKTLTNMMHQLYPNDKFEFFFIFKWKGREISTFRQFGQIIELPFERLPFLRKLIYRLSPNLASYLNSRFFRKRVIKLKPDLIYFNYITEDDFSREAAGLSIPLIWHLHELGISLSTLSKQWINLFTSRASLLLACSNATAAYYQNHFDIDNTRLKILHSPPSYQILQDNLSKMELPGLYHSAIVKIGVAATFSYVKGPDTFIRAASLVHRKNPNVAFYWIGISAGQSSGSDPYFESCVKLTKELGLDNFHFLRETPHIGSFYEEIDILAIPSRSEGLPLSMQEAMLFKKPVVAMNVGGIPEILNNETGYLVRDQTPEAFAAGLMYFIDNQQERITIGNNAHKKIMTHFEASIIAPRWAALMTEIYESTH